MPEYTEAQKRILQIAQKAASACCQAKFSKNPLRYEQAYAQLLQAFALAEKVTTMADLLKQVPTDKVRREADLFYERDPLLESIDNITTRKEFDAWYAEHTQETFSKEVIRQLRRKRKECRNQ